MVKRIVYTRPDGGLSIVNPVPKAQRPGESEADFLARVMAKDVPAGAVGAAVVDAAEIPRDRTFRDAWRAPDAGDADRVSETPAVAVSMTAARAIHMGRIRAARDVALAALDVPQQRAMVAGDTAEVQRIEAEKQALRDLPQTFDLTGAASATELKSRWPADLAGSEPQVATR